MVRTGAGSPEPRWTLRDWLAAAGLFLATAAVVLWQNAHVAVLLDLSYILNTAERIALGQMPYRDFPLAHAPLTFLIQAAIIRLTGRVFFHHVLYAAIVGGLGTVLAWSIALRSLRGRVAAAWPVALLLAAAAYGSGHLLHRALPDTTATAASGSLVAIYCCSGSDAETSTWFGFAAGAALCVPLFFKQNIGLPFLAGRPSLPFLSLALNCVAGKIRPPGRACTHSVCRPRRRCATLAAAAARAPFHGRPRQLPSLDHRSLRPSAACPVSA